METYSFITIMTYRSLWKGYLLMNAKTDSCTEYSREIFRLEYLLKQPGVLSAFGRNFKNVFCLQNIIMILAHHSERYIRKKN